MCVLFNKTSTKNCVQSRFSMENWLISFWDASRFALIDDFSLFIQKFRFYLQIAYTNVSLILSEHFKFQKCFIGTMLKLLLFSLQSIIWTMILNVSIEYHHKCMTIFVKLVKCSHAIDFNKCVFKNHCQILNADKQSESRRLFCRFLVQFDPSL